PELGGPVKACAQGGFSVGTEGNCPDRALMLKPMTQLSRGHIPEPRAVVPASAEQRLAIGTKSDSCDQLVVLKDNSPWLARCDIPNLHMTIIRASRRHHFTVGAKSRGLNIPFRVQR